MKRVIELIIIFIIIGLGFILFLGPKQVEIYDNTYLSNTRYLDLSNGDKYTFFGLFPEAKNSISPKALEEVVKQYGISITDVKGSNVTLSFDVLKVAKATQDNEEVAQFTKSAYVTATIDFKTLRVLNLHGDFAELATEAAQKSIVEEQAEQASEVDSVNEEGSEVESSEREEQPTQFAKDPQFTKLSFDLTFDYNIKSVASIKDSDKAVDIIKTILGGGQESEEEEQTSAAE